MRNLPLPSRDGARSDLATALKTYKYRGKTHGYTATEAEIDGILSLYDKYDADAAAPCKELRGLDYKDELREALNDAYDKTQRSRKLERIRTLVFSDIEKCPICGIDPVVELDHHLPRSKFKPLSIYTRNLVPLCHTCNHTKLAHSSDSADDDRRFAHPYFDQLPDTVFLRANVELKEGALAVNFEVDASSGLSESLSNRLSYQLSELHLNERYEGEVNTYLSGMAAAAHLIFQFEGPKGVRNLFLAQARTDTKNLYRNHWRPVLLRALANHEEFCNGGFATAFPMPESVLQDLENPDQD